MIPHRATPRTDAELRRQFDWALEQALQGHCRTGLDLDGRVQDALLAIMDATPNPPAALIEGARSAFADQIAGVQPDSNQDEMLALLRQSRRPS